MLEGALTMNTVGEAGSKSQLREIPWESLKKKKKNSEDDMREARWKA